MPNIFAYAALLVWPLVVAVLFRQMPLRPALIWSILAGLLLLPVNTEINFPLVPSLDKMVVPALAALVMCLATPVPAGVTLRGWLPQGVVGRALVAMFVASPFATALTNGEPVNAGFGSIPGLSIFDAVSTVLRQVALVLPFLLARRYLADERAHELLLRILVAAGIAYSALILIELRLSPQLHSWVYGFFPHSFLQHVRSWGYRPLVFLGHGLWVAIFMAFALLAAVALWRGAGDGRRRGRLLAASGWLGLVLVLCKSLGALVLGAAFALLLGAGGRRMVLPGCTLAAALVLTYPALRGADLVPTGLVAEAALSVSAERAGSLQFRFDNEDILLARANEKPLFGWGSWGRNRVYDVVSGRDASITDGRWVIVIGSYGWLGYLAEFGLLTLPLILLATGGVRRQIGLPTAALGVVLTVNLLDMLPNASLMPLSWLLAGALLGRVEEIARAPRRRAPPRPAGSASGGSAGAVAGGARAGVRRAAAGDLPINMPRRDPDAP